MDPPQGRTLHVHQSVSGSAINLELGNCSNDKLLHILLYCHWSLDLQVLEHQISSRCEIISPSENKCAHLETFAISVSVYVSI